jgi:probable HAF family extracellular repeat protein
MGESENGEIDPVTGIPENVAVIWKHREITSLGTLGGAFSFGNAMNNRGQVVGIALNAIPDPLSYVGLGTQTRAFLWQDGQMQDLGTLGGPDSWSAFVNERGQIVGWSYTDSMPNPTTGVPTQHPFLWEDGKMQDLKTLGGTLAVVGALGGSGGGAINNEGQVVGTSNLAGDLTHHPFLWDRGILKDLGTLGGNNGEAFWINDEREVVGQADLPGPGAQLHHGFLWKHGAMTDLGTVEGDPCSRALVINSRGQIAGASTNCTEFLHAFLWENGGPMVNLNRLVSPESSLKLTSVNYINDRGEIAATGILPNGDHHAVLLIPNADCDDECDARIAANENSVAASPHPAMKQRGGETPANRADQLRNRLWGRYQVPSHAVAPSN